MKTLQVEREQAIHLLRAGLTSAAVAAQLGRSAQWVRKCRRRFEAESWAGLAGRSRAPHHQARKTPHSINQAIKEARSQLEAEAARGEGLKYIGAMAIRTLLKKWQVTPLPSVRTIERALQNAQLTHPRSAPIKNIYPRLRPKLPHTLCQVDHIPRYLQGGEKVYYFNTIDVVSRYPTGQVKSDRRAKTAADFLVHVWQTVGLPRYTQVDNEACFIGGFTHAYVLGQCVRLALRVGTKLVFSPVRHPQSNAYVERFHQDYQKHVWEDTYLVNPLAVQNQAEHFFELYRHSRHHSALREQTPDELHRQPSQQRLPSDFSRPSRKMPLYVGCVHFMRRVDPDGTVSVLNVKWTLPNPGLTQGIWATLAIKLQGATLSIYDQAPDVAERKLLTAHPFHISEPVLVRPVMQAETILLNTQTPSRQQRETHRGAAFFSISPGKAHRWPQSFRSQARRVKQFLSETMY